MTARRKKGTGTLIRRADGLYEGRYKDRDGKRRSVYARSKGEAEEKLEAAMLRAGQGIEHLTQRLTLADYLTGVWLPHIEANLSHRSHEEYSRVVRRHIIPRIGSIAITNLKPSDVNALLSGALADGMAAGSVSRMRAILSGAMRYAEADGLISRNVVRLSRAPHIRRTEPKWLNREQISRLLEAVRNDRYEPLYVLAITTGIRHSELLGLCWRDVDFEAGTIRIERQLQYRDGRLIAVATKTDSADRNVDIDEPVLAILRKHKARADRERLAAGNLYDPAGWMFTRDASGVPLTPTGRQNHWQDLRKRLGLDGTRFHDLRHSAATHMLALGASAKVVQRTLGHSSVHTTLGIYAHVTEEAARDNARAMSGLLQPISA